MFLRQKVPWTSQPPAGTPIDWSNPLCRGIALVIDRDMLHIQGLGAPTVSGTIDVAANRLGCGLKFDSTDQIYYPAPTALEVLDGISCLWAGVCLDSSTINFMFGVMPSGSNGASYTPFTLHGSHVGIADFTLNRANAGGYRVWSAASQLTSTPGVHVVKQGGNISVAPKFFKDGAAYTGTVTNGFSGAGSGAAEALSSNLYIARRADGSAQLKGVHILGVVWNREVTDAEALALSANPWQIFKP